MKVYFVIKSPKNCERHKKCMAVLFKQVNIVWGNEQHFVLNKITK